MPEVFSMGPGGRDRTHVDVLSSTQSLKETVRRIGKNIILSENTLHDNSSTCYYLKYRLKHRLLFLNVAIPMGWILSILIIVLHTSN